MPRVVFLKIEAVKRLLSHMMNSGRYTISNTIVHSFNFEKNFRTFVFTTIEGGWSVAKPIFSNTNFKVMCCPMEGFIAIKKVTLGVSRLVEQ